MLARAVCRRLARAPPRTGLARRHQSSLAEIVAERYASDPKFYQFTAGVISLVLAQRLYDSRPSGSKSHEKAPTTHEAPAAAAPVQEEPENEAAPAVVETSTPPAETAPIETARLAPAPAPNGKVLPTAVYEPPAPAPNEQVLPVAVWKVLPTAVYEPPAPAPNGKVLPTAVYEPPAPNDGVGEGGANAWVVDFDADDRLEGISADAAWLLVTRRGGGGGEARLLAVPGIRAVAAEPAVDLTPAPRVTVDKARHPAWALLSHCLGTAWALRGHCMGTAWALRGHCLDTAWGHCLRALRGRCMRTVHCVRRLRAR